MAQPQGAPRANTEQTPSGTTAYEDVGGWWSALLRNGIRIRFFGRPHLYFPPGLEYVPRQNVSSTDGLGRTNTYAKPYECTIDPVTGKFKTLYVQSTGPICDLSLTTPNCTWKRTPIRNVTSVALRVATIPFRSVPAKTRYDRSKYTAEDWAVVVLMWIPAVLCYLVSVSRVSSSNHENISTDVDHLPSSSTLAEATPPRRTGRSTCPFSIGLSDILAWHAICSKTDQP